MIEYGTTHMHWPCWEFVVCLTAVTALTAYGAGVVVVWSEAEVVDRGISVLEYWEWNVALLNEDFRFCW